MAPRRKFDFKFKEKVLQFAEENSGEKAARHFNIDSKRIRYWRKQKAQLLLADKSRARLTGAGRKKVSLQLERKLSDWIYSMRDQHSRVSRNMIKNKALEIYPSVSDGGKMFVASTGWLQRFLQRNDLSLRRRAPTAQTDPDLLTQKLVSFVDFVGKTVRSKGVSERDIIAMDETAVWFDPVSPTPETRGAKSPGPEESHLTVVLAARADGTKLKPYVVFRGAAGEAKPPQQRSSGAVVASSVNGWMNDALTADWLQSVVGKVSATPRLLVWDSYRCHIGAATKAELKRGYNITTAEIPGGCAKYIQAPDVMWNRPFKQSLQDAYSLWVAGGADKEHTAGGNLKAPSHRLLVDWVVAAWDKLDTDLIRESFKVCGLSVKPDGSEDDLILCFREGQPCAAGRGALSQARQRSQENRCEAVQGEEDEEELFNNELVVFDDDEEEGDNGEDEEEEEDGDHMSLHCFIHQALPSKDKKQIIIKEEQQDWSSSLDQEDPETPHIKEEQEEVWTSQEGEQLQGLEEADITKFPFTPVPVKSEDDEEKPQSSQLHQRQTEQMETEADGGPEPARNSDPDRHLQPGTDDKTSESLKSNDISLSDVGYSTGEKQFSCSECGRRFRHKGHLQIHMRCHTGEKPFSCSVCGKRFPRKENLVRHMRFHSGEKPFSCSFCKKHFTRSDHAVTHMRIHTGEKPFSCSVCGKSFTHKLSLKHHMPLHTEERPFSCSVCDKRFTRQSHVRSHKCVSGSSDSITAGSDETFSCDEPLEQQSVETVLDMFEMRTSEEECHCSSAVGKQQRPHI